MLLGSRAHASEKHGMLKPVGATPPRPSRQSAEESRRAERRVVICADQGGSEAQAQAEGGGSEPEARRTAGRRCTPFVRAGDEPATDGRMGARVAEEAVQYLEEAMSRRDAEAAVDGTLRCRDHKMMPFLRYAGVDDEDTLMDEAGEVKRVVICATTPRDDTHGVVAARPPRRKATPFSRPGDAPEAPLVTFADDAGREGQPPEVARRCKERKPTPYQRADPRIDVEADAASDEGEVASETTSPGPSGSSWRILAHLGLREAFNVWCASSPPVHQPSEPKGAL